jgi:ATP-dependent DNA helicase RecG
MKIIDEIQKGESKILELKEKLPQNESIAKTMIAFANTAGGKLVVGVNDDKEVVGISGDELFSLHDKIASILDDSCSPGILPEIYSINVNNKLLLVVEVDSGPLKPYFLKNRGKSGGTYIRIGATNRVADAENIAELERQKRHISYDEEISYEAELSELDTDSLTEQFQAVNKQLDTKKMENLKLIKMQGGKLSPTHALMIILGKYPHCLVKCARFKGTSMSVFIDKKEYGGNIFSVLENSMNFILNHINLRGEIKGLQRTDTYEIPVSALREALINAIVHRDYVNRGRDIKVAVYDDRISILSPGSLPFSLTFEDVLNGRSVARNRVVAHVFKELGYIEQWGSGINRIIEQCVDFGMEKPTIAEKNDFFEVSFPRPQKNKPADIVGKSSENRRISAETRRKTDRAPADTGGKPAEYNDQERMVLEYLYDKLSITSKKVEELLTIKDSRAREVLSQLVEKGYIAKKGKGRSTYYTLAEENRHEEQNS